MYVLHFGDNFLGEAKKLDSSIKRQIKKKLEQFRSGAIKAEPLHGALSGKYKIRSGKYRIILKFLNDKDVLLLNVGLRDKIYK
jgi:mRNA-degrading endonuclease RelE of RelBE toxin-antitoxin system